MRILIILAIIAAVMKPRRPPPVQPLSLEDLFDQDSDSAEKSLAFISAMQQGRGNLAAQLMPAPSISPVVSQAVANGLGFRVDPIFRFI